MEKQEIMIPLFVHEAEMERMDRNNKRWFAAFLVVLVMLFATNFGWVVYENSFEDIIVEQQASVDGDGTALNANGGVDYFGSNSEADD